MVRLDTGAYPPDVEFKLESETRIVIGRLAAPSDPERAWWWQSTTMRHGAEVIVGGLAKTENDAILEATATTIDLHAIVLPEVPSTNGSNGSNGSHADAAELIWSAPSPDDASDVVDAEVPPVR